MNGEIAFANLAIGSPVIAHVVNIIVPTGGVMPPR